MVNFSLSDGFHQLSEKTEEQVSHVLKANMERFISQYELGQKIKLSLLLKKCWQGLRCRIGKVNKY